MKTFNWHAIIGWLQMIAGGIGFIDQLFSQMLPIITQPGFQFNSAGMTVLAVSFGVFLSGLHKQQNIKQVGA